MVFPWQTVKTIRRLNHVNIYEHLVGQNPKNLVMLDDSPSQMDISIVMGAPQNGWFVREHPIKMDDDWWYPYFRKPPYGNNNGEFIVHRS